MSPGEEEVVGGACEPWREVEANHGELALAPVRHVLGLGGWSALPEHRLPGEALAAAGPGADGVWK